MNQFKATVSHIESEDVLHIVKFDFQGTALSMMSLELSKEIKVGTEVILTIKSTYIALAKELKGMLSYSSIIPAEIKKIDNGKLLSSITLDAHGYQLESIITAQSSKRMSLLVGDKVHMLIKASELSIVKVIDV